MKTFLLALVLTSLLSQVSAQINPNFGSDSTALIQKITLIKLQNQLSEAQKVQGKLARADEQSEADRKIKEEQSAADRKVKEATDMKALIGDSTPTALSGNITFSENKNSLAETRALVYQNLDLLIGKFITQLSDNKCVPFGCNKDSIKNIIIYNETYYKAIPDYNAFIEEMKLIKGNYSGQISSIENGLAQSASGVLAVTNAAVKALIGLSTLFRTETDFQINDEFINESILVSKIRNKDACCFRNYYYPTLYPISSSSKSTLISSIIEIDSLQETLSNAIKIYKNTEKKPLNEKKKGIEGLKKELEEKMAKTKIAAEKEAIQKEIVAKTDSISAINKKIDTIGQKYDNLKAKTDVIYGRLKDELNKVDTVTKTSLLRNLLKLEGILEKINVGAFTLRITAKAKGTNKIKKFLWGTTLRHSAFVEMEYQLFDNKAVLSQADATYEYAQFKNSRNIK